MDMNGGDAAIISKGQGGVAFEVKLKEADCESPFKSLDPNKPTITEELISEKLDSAAQRRLSINSAKQTNAAKEMKRAQDAKQRVQMEVELKKKKIEQELAADLEAKEQNRLQIIEDMKMKLQKRLAAHAMRVSAIEETLNGARKELSSRIQAEQGLAEDRRNKQLEEMLKRIKEHEARVEEIHQHSEEAESTNKELLERHMEKMETTLKNREEQLSSLLERLKEHNVHVDNIRRSKLTNGANSADSE